MSNLLGVAKAKLIKLAKGAKTIAEAYKPCTEKRMG